MSRIGRKRRFEGRKDAQLSDLTAGEWQYGSSQGEVEKVVRDGVPQMPGYAGKVSDTEVTNVPFYIRKMCGKVESLAKLVSCDR